MERLDHTANDIEMFEALKKIHGVNNVYPSYLRLEAALDNSNPLLVFEIIDNSSTRLECEKKLLNSDAFVAMRMKAGIYERNATLKDAAIKLLETYPNEAAFTTDATLAFLKPHLTAFWTSDLRIERNGQADIEGLSMSEFYEASVTQKTGVSNFSSGLGSDQGTVELVPRMSFLGNGDNKISIQPKLFAGRKWANIAPLENRAVLIFKGFLIKGAGKRNSLFE